MTFEEQLEATRDLLQGIITVLQGGWRIQRGKVCPPTTEDETYFRVTIAHLQHTIEILNMMEQGNTNGRF